MLQSLIGSFVHCPVYGVKGYFTSQFIAKIAIMNVNFEILRRKTHSFVLKTLFCKDYFLLLFLSIFHVKGGWYNDEPGHVLDNFTCKQ